MSEISVTFSGLPFEKRELNLLISDDPKSTYSLVPIPSEISISKVTDCYRKLNKLTLCPPPVDLILAILHGGFLVTDTLVEDLGVR